MADVPLSARLARFLGAEARRPFVWGEADCALFVADWVRLCTGSDPAADLRGRYSCHRSAALVWQSGLSEIVRKCALTAGLVEAADHAGVGSIAVLRAPGGDVCAIRTCVGWVMRDRRSIVCIADADAEVVACWSVGGLGHG